MAPLRLGTAADLAQLRTYRLCGFCTVADFVSLATPDGSSDADGSSLVAGCLSLSAAPPPPARATSEPCRRPA